MSRIDESPQPSSKMSFERSSIDRLDIRSTSNDNQRIAEAIVFSTLLVCGVGLVAIVVFGDIDWFLPSLGFGFATYVATVRFRKKKSRAPVLHQSPARPAPESDIGMSELSPNKAVEQSR